MDNKPKKAATVIVVRDATEQEGIEVLMLKRHPGNAFAPSVFVFPGGAMDAVDADLIDVAESNFANDYTIPGLDGLIESLPFWVTAIRETFEEAGLLFATTEDDSLLQLHEDATAARFDSYRKQLHQKDISFNALVTNEKLHLAVDKLKYFSHWITPAMFEIRYDTRFFIAQVPEQQTAAFDGIEHTEQVWISPAKALQLYDVNKFPLVFPTLMTLKELENFSDTEHALL